jgi:4-amino-4-deoxy-L-arabinose transferase-like glycosyltransferase
MMKSNGNFKEKPTMRLNSSPVIWTGLWIVLMAVSLSTRPLLPVDETRYLAVAWEMWHRNDFLVPYLNGETYSHKPPLLFWAFHLGWTVFGINEWWPRLIAPFFGLGSLFLTAKLATQLWPERHQIADIAPIILLGCIFWTLFTTMTMFDMIVTFFSLLGLVGILMAWRARCAGQSSRKGFFILAIAIGFGLLAKGPAILLHTLPVALLAPLWIRRLETTADTGRPFNWPLWYASIIGATLVGTAIVLVWALPAAYVGGEAYANAIFWGQSAGRMVDSFAHNRPFWWYAAVLLPLLLPWAVWPRLWQAIKQSATANLNDGGIRLCLIWFLTAFIAFSLISGKQLHYLLPEFPALALMGAYFLTGAKTLPALDRKTIWLPAFLFFALGAAAVFVAPHLLADRFQARYPGLNFDGAGLIALSAATLLWLPIRTLRQTVLALTALSVAVTIAAHLVLFPMLRDNFDVRPLAEKLGTWERQGFRFAHMTKYHGQYHFAGRLIHPIPLVGNANLQLENWMAKNPGGRVITYYNPGKIPTVAKPVYVRRFRGTFVVIWDVKTILAHPKIAYRR